MRKMGSGYEKGRCPLCKHHDVHVLLTDLETRKWKSSKHININEDVALRE
jgi:hypothetical protein